MGFLNVLESRAKQYAENLNATYLPVGAKSEGAEIAIANAACQVENIHGPFDQVWSAAASATLSKGLQRGFKTAQIVAVQVGMETKDTGRARVVPIESKLEKKELREAPFPSCPYYDRKAWFAYESEFRKMGSHPAKVLFWNVMS